MIRATYRSGTGKEYDITFGQFYLFTSQFRGYQWTPETTELSVGVSVDRFTKKPKTYKATLVVIGDEITRHEALDELHSNFETDIYNLTPSRIYINGAYIECYINQSQVMDKETDVATVDEIEIYCPYPFWIEEQVEVFRNEGAQTTEGGKIYDYEYPYRYGKSARVNRYVEVDHYAPSNFIMSITGNANDVSINIGDNVYAVDYPIYDGDRLVIDSRSTAESDRRVYIVHDDGTVSNVFNWRSTRYSIFEKIPAGKTMVSYSGNLDVQITILKERSEFPWK